MAAHHLPELPLALQGARAEFAVRLSRRVEALLQLVSLLERAPGSVTHRAQLNAYLVTLAAVAAALGYERVESALRQASDQLARIGPSEPFLPSHAATLRSTVGEVASLCWETPVTAPPPIGAQSPTPGAVGVPNGGPSAAHGTPDSGDCARVGLAGRRAVVVDDDPAVVWFLAGLLSSAGVEVLEAHDGQRALDLVYQAWPDFVLSDLLMPGLDGIGLCEAIQRDPAVRDVPVMLLSWKEDLLQYARELGIHADAYLTKQTRGSEVLGRIQEALRPRASLEHDLSIRQSVSGRLDEFSPGLVLKLVSEYLRDAHVDVHQARFCYELEIRDGRLRTALRTSTRGEFERGPIAIARLLGVSSGDFSVVPSTSPCPRWFAGSLAEVLAPHLAVARAATRALRGASLFCIERVEFDQAGLLQEVAGLPHSLVELVRQIQHGVSPRELCAAGASQRLETVLAPLARSGIVLAAYGPDGSNPCCARRPELAAGDPQQLLAGPAHSATVPEPPGELPDTASGVLAQGLNAEAADRVVDLELGSTVAAAGQDAPQYAGHSWPAGMLPAYSPDPPRLAEPTLPLWDVASFSAWPRLTSSSAVAASVPDSIDDFESAWELASADLRDYVSPAPPSTQDWIDVALVGTPRPEASVSSPALLSAPGNDPIQSIDESDRLEQGSLSESAVLELRSSDIVEWYSVVPPVAASTPGPSRLIDDAPSMAAEPSNEPTRLPESIRAESDEAQGQPCPEAEEAARKAEEAERQPELGCAEPGSALQVEACVVESTESESAEATADTADQVGDEAQGQPCPEAEEAAGKAEEAERQPELGCAESDASPSLESLVPPAALPGWPEKPCGGNADLDQTKNASESSNPTVTPIPPPALERDGLVRLLEPSSPLEHERVEPLMTVESGWNSEMTPSWRLGPAPDSEPPNSDPPSREAPSVPLSSLFAPSIRLDPPPQQNAMSDVSALPVRKIHFPTRPTSQPVWAGARDASTAASQTKGLTPAPDSSQPPATTPSEAPETNLNEPPPRVELGEPGPGYLGPAKTALITVLTAVLSFGAVRWWIAPGSHTAAAAGPSAVSSGLEAPASSLLAAGRSPPLRTKAVQPEQVKVEDFSLPNNVILPNNKALLEVSVGDRQAIYVDEAFVGLGPVRPVVLSPGPHDVRVRFDGAERTYPVVVQAMRMARLSIGNR